MKLPTLLLALLSTAAIAGPYDVYIEPACYVKGQAEYSAEKCPKPKIEPAYYRPNYGAMLSRPAPTFDYGRSSELPAPTNHYDTPARKPAGGLYLIGEYGNGDYGITAPDGALTICSSSSCFVQ